MERKEFYINRLQQVISYIRTQYNNKISINKLEELSNFSYRNLQRIFKAYHEETLGAFVTRLKVENSAKLLLFSKDKIKEIAEKVGYADVQSYSKSFKKHYGITPAVYRAKKEKLFKINSKEATVIPFFENRITVLEAKKVIYKTYKGDYYDPKIEEVWNQLISEINHIQIDVNTLESFGIIWDEPIISEIISYNYDACLVINDTIEIFNGKFKIKTIPSQEYAVFKHIGDYQSIGKTYDKIFSSWLFSSKKEISEHPFLEFYIKNEQHTKNPKEYETEIYIPLKG